MLKKEKISSQAPVSGLERPEDSQSKLTGGTYSESND